MSGIPQSFRAALLDGPGQRTRIVTTSLSSPVSPNELGIRVTATAINPAD